MSKCILSYEEERGLVSLSDKLNFEEGMKKINKEKKEKEGEK